MKRVVAYPLIIGIVAVLGGIIALATTCDRCQKYAYHPATQKELRRAAPPKVCKKWQYRKVSQDELDEGGTEKVLNKLGAEGWELVNRPASGSGDYLFKKCAQ